MEVQTVDIIAKSQKNLLSSWSDKQTTWLKLFGSKPRIRLQKVRKILSAPNRLTDYRTEMCVQTVDLIAKLQKVKKSYQDLSAWSDKRRTWQNIFGSKLWTWLQKVRKILLALNRLTITDDGPEMWVQTVDLIAKTQKNINTAEHQFNFLRRVSWP